MNRRTFRTSFLITCLAVLSAACGASGADAPGRAAAPFVVCITSAPGAYWQTATTADSSTDTSDVMVNDSAVVQTWEGFGGTFNEMGWTYLNTKALQDQALQLLFGKDGCRFAWGRIPMGSSDYAVDRYTLNETPDDVSMSTFSLDRDKKRLIPFIKAAQAVNPDVRFWASPWTPPTWMKEGPFPPMSKNPFDGGQIKGDEQTYKALARYFVKFVQAYDAQGIKIEFVAPQNEPNYSQEYPSCHWAKEQFTAFVPHLDQALRDAKLNTAIMLGTMSNAGGNKDLSIIADVMNNPAARTCVKVIGVQYGVADRAASLRSYNLPI
jgi:glucosylceramidase